MTVKKCTDTSGNTCASPDAVLAVMTVWLRVRADRRCADPGATLAGASSNAMDVPLELLSLQLWEDEQTRSPPGRQSGYAKTGKDGHGHQPFATMNSHQGMNDFRDSDTKVKRRTFPQIGVRAYGVAAIVLGAAGFAWGDFATNWQRVGPNVPYRESLAYFTAVFETTAGLAMLWRRTARAGALLLTILYSIFTLLWVIQVCAAPLVYDGWGNLFEELSLVIGGAVAYASLAPAGSRWAGNSVLISRVYGICPISFAIVHLINLAGVATWVPKWIPPEQMFWAIATAICFLLAAAAILSGIQAGLAALLLTVELMGFEILVWLPKLIAAPRERFNWAGNAISLTMVAAVWVVSDALNEPRRFDASSGTSIP